MSQDKSMNHEDLNQEELQDIRLQLESIDFETPLKTFKAINNENRLKIVYVLSLVNELCVHDIVETVGISFANASYHLQVLLKEEVVQNRREGKHQFYSLRHDTIDLMKDFLNIKSIQS